jgi:FixJ family two-component response regulator
MASQELFNERKSGIVELLLQGKSDRQIALALGVSSRNRISSEQYLCQNRSYFTY